MGTRNRNVGVNFIEMIFNGMELQGITQEQSEDDRLTTS